MLSSVQISEKQFKRCIERTSSDTMQQRLRQWSP